ncbi:MAG: GtrA family protein [uncultured bacterium]|nr:MAG: GtrA family protein [uncultured bacterium]OGT33187.1 MAG: hypothetical protein A3C44_06350 [Gammaproteobacteria bacterium RIFCSPHIGHO2_02_FULL_39_13]OGT49230.1 MAG: hypothetical protein A3E53_07185 [Gammaproteobacteria bacterium RIFCSPHIGHO2_12_FULL_39_24]
MNINKGLLNHVTILLKYTTSSLSSYLIDFCFFVLFYHCFSTILLSVVLARILSSTYNFTINHRVVFQSNQTWRVNCIPYFMLSVFAIAASYGMILWFIKNGIQVYPSKIIADTLIYFCNFYIQKIYIFK